MKMNISFGNPISSLIYVLKISFNTILFFLIDYEFITLILYNMKKFNKKEIVIFAIYTDSLWEKNQCSNLIFSLYVSNKLQTKINKMNKK